MGEAAAVIVFGNRLPRAADAIDRRRAAFATRPGLLPSALEFPIKGRAHVFAVQGFVRCGVPEQAPAYYLCAMRASVLDLSPVTTGGSGAAALRNSIDLARLADRLGYTRYWVAEHHNLPSVASSAPDIMIGQIAAATARIRVGSGGIMLPNHAPLTVAERFHTLEALFPGRIDLGIGRAPGTDPVTSVALRRRRCVIFSLPRAASIGRPSGGHHVESRAGI